MGRPLSEDFRTLRSPLRGPPTLVGMFLQCCTFNCKLYVHTRCPDGSLEISATLFGFKNSTFSVTQIIEFQPYPLKKKLAITTQPSWCYLSEPSIALSLHTRWETRKNPILTTGANWIKANLTYFWETVFDKENSLDLNSMP